MHEPDMHISPIPRSHHEEEDEDKTDIRRTEETIVLHSRILEKTEQYDTWFYIFAGNRRFARE
jgi:hypothetical protein